MTFESMPPADGRGEASEQAEHRGAERQNRASKLGLALYGEATADLGHHRLKIELAGWTATFTEGWKWLEVTAEPDGTWRTAVGIRQSGDTRPAEPLERFCVTDEEVRDALLDWLAIQL